MALDKEFKDIPGTIVFDAEQSRKGYWLNQFCMSLTGREEPLWRTTLRARARRSAGGRRRRRPAAPPGCSVF